jgi:chromosomal replication initiator protein
MAVANKPGGTSFNPLIFGGVGLEKHLAHAIGVEIKINILKNCFIHFC